MSKSNEDNDKLLEDASAMEDLLKAERKYPPVRHSNSHQITDRDSSNRQTTDTSKFGCFSFLKCVFCCQCSRSKQRRDENRNDKQLSSTSRTPREQEDTDFVDGKKDVILPLLPTGGTPIKCIAQSNFKPIYDDVPEEALNSNRDTHRNVPDEEIANNEVA